MNPPNQPTLAPTPRTDAATKEHTSSDIFFDYVLPQDMATLERELAAEREKVRVLREHGVEALMVARSWQLVWGDRISPDSVACFTQHEQAFLAALAATEEGTP